jgi:proteic killer suppression protein
VDILFASTKLEKTFNSQKKLLREYGEQAKKIQLRMAVLRAAPTLAHVPVAKPDRLHELYGDRKGCFAVDLKHPYRLIFESADLPVPRKSDGGIRKDQVVSIRILTVEDYH